MTLVVGSCVATSSVLHASPVHHWSQRFGNASTDQNGNGVAVDGSGNVVVVGGFLGTVNFGGANLTSAGAGDIFVAAFDNDGDHQWSTRFGDANPNQVANAVAMDAVGNVVIAGNHWGTVNFGGAPLTSVGGDDVFLAKFNPSGGHLWSKRFGDASTGQTGRAVRISGAGDVMLAGSFAGTIDFGDGLLMSGGALDVFVARFESDGDLMWSRRFGGINDQVLESIDVDATGSVVLCGYFDGTVDFGGGPLVSAGNNDIFLAKLDSDGDHVWSKRFGSGNDQEGAAVVIDGDGDVIAAGAFESTVNFGGSTLTSAGSKDTFLAKFTSGGVHDWSQGFGTVGDQTATAVAVDDSDDIGLTGSFASTIDFGGGTLTNNGSLDIFVARFLADGSHMWSAAFGGTSDQLAEAIAIDASNKIALAGSFFSTVDFGGGNLTSAGGTDIFLAQLGDEPPDPVFITSFDAHVLPSAIEIRWEVWSDELLERYELYRREDIQPQAAVVASGRAQAGGYSVIDDGVQEGRTYHYTLVIRTRGGIDIQSTELTVMLPNLEPALGQNQPNPFSDITQFEIRIEARGPVRIAIYDIRGRRVRVWDEMIKEVGRYQWSWDGRDTAGRMVASGTYFYRVESPRAVEARKMLLVR
jgi:FlgD Ig-like domain